MKAICKKVWSTRQKYSQDFPVIPEARFPNTTQIVPIKPALIAEDTEPSKEAAKKCSDIFCFDALANKQQDSIYIDLMETFNCMTYLFVMYCYNADVILWNQCYAKKQYKYLRKKNFPPILKSWTIQYCMQSRNLSKKKGKFAAFDSSSGS